MKPSMIEIGILVRMIVPALIGMGIIKASASQTETIAVGITAAIWMVLSYQWSRKDDAKQTTKAVSDVVGSFLPPPEKEDPAQLRFPIEGTIGDRETR